MTLGQLEILNRNVAGYPSTDLDLDQVQAEARDFYSRQAELFAKILNESWSEYTNRPVGK
jgi:hypothetical protein